MKTKKELINDILNENGKCTRLGYLLVWILCKMIIDWKEKHKGELPNKQPL